METVISSHKQCTAVGRSVCFVRVLLHADQPIPADLVANTVTGLLQTRVKALRLAHRHLLLLQLTNLLLSLLLLLCVCPDCCAATLPGNTAGSVTVTCVRLDGKSFIPNNATDPSRYSLEVGIHSRPAQL
jgi:hypothetical protein